MRKPRKLPKVCSSPLKKRGLCRGHDVALHELANMAGTKNWASSRGITYFRLEAEDRTTTVVAWTHQLHVQRCSLFSKRYSFQISSTAASSWKQQTLRCGQSVVLQCVLYFVLVCCSPVPGEPKPKVLWESRAPGVHVRGRSGLGQLSLCSETILFTKRLNPNFGFLSSPQLGDWDVFSSSFHSSGAGPKSPCPGPSRARARAATTPELGAESPNVVATPRAPGHPPLPDHVLCTYHPRSKDLPGPAAQLRRTAISLHLFNATLLCQEQSESTPVQVSSIAVEAVIHGRESIHAFDMLDLGRQRRC